MDFQYISAESVLGRTIESLLAETGALLHPWGEKHVADALVERAAAQQQVVGGGYDLRTALLLPASESPAELGKLDGVDLGRIFAALGKEEEEGVSEIAARWETEMLTTDARLAKWRALQALFRRWGPHRIMAAM